MADQTTEYEGGAPQRLTEDYVLQLARGASSFVPSGFLLGMATRESGLVANEIDTDYDPNGNARTLKTYGLLQVNVADAARAADPLSVVDPRRMLDPATNLAIGASVLRQYYDALDGTGASSRDVWAYVAWGHNAGIGEATRSVDTYGLDWAAAKARPQNAWFTGRLIPYVDFVLSKMDQHPETGEGSGGDDGFGERVLLIGAAALLLLSGGA